MRQRAAFAVLLFTAACYSPTVEPGAPCSADGTCPAYLVCDTMQQVPVCVRAATDGGGSTLDGPLGDGPPDGQTNVCVTGDGVCLNGCLGMDPDCNTTCGDGRCIGNAGELCSGCPQDCDTLSAVCGNGACDPGEAPSCYADCGPTPWTWLSEEAQLTALINSTRTGGYRCPNFGHSMTAPALAAGNYLADAREWVWEIAHQDYYDDNDISCNGRTFEQRAHGKAYVTYLNADGYPTINDALNIWLGDAGACDLLMDPTLVNVQVAVAHDVEPAYVVLFGD